VTVVYQRHAAGAHPSRLLVLNVSGAPLMPVVRCFFTKSVKRGSVAKGTYILMKCLFHSTLLILILAAPGICQEKQIPLKDKRITITMEAQPLGEVFRHLMRHYDIPIGFEESVLDREWPDFEFETNGPSVGRFKSRSADGRIKISGKGWRVFRAQIHPITLYIEDGSVEEVFDEIVRQMEHYKWEINDDVVNIIPVKGRDERFEKLLGVRVNRFTLEEGKTVEDITTGIRALPEFMSFMRAHKLHFTGYREGSNFINQAQYGRVVREKMDFSGLTFRELLNRITKVKRGGWRLKWKWISRTTGEEHIDIDI
jgi:hypothetical protein